MLRTMPSRPVAVRCVLSSSRYMKKYEPKTMALSMRSMPQSGNALREKYHFAILSM